MKPQQAILTSFKRLKDKSVNVTFNLQEISSEDFMEIDTEIDSFGIVYFSLKGILTEQEKKAIDDVSLEVNGKTQSERIRNVLYRLHEQSDTEESFEMFYKRKTNEVVEHWKSKLI